MNPILALILSFVLNLLLDYLKKLIEQWLHPQPASVLAASKGDFMATVHRRWWYGARRLDVASKLYDKAVARYAASAFALPVQTASGAPLLGSERDTILRIMTDGLTLTADEVK